jgi:hypothetical protein
VIDRTGFIQGPERITVQNVPPQIYPAAYACRFFNKAQFLEKFNSYTLIAMFDSYCDPPCYLPDGLLCSWQGFYFKQITNNS